MTDDASSHTKTPPPLGSGSGGITPSRDVPALTQLGQFRIIEKIGQGGMGAVFKAEQISLNRPVALKILPESLAKDYAFIERFQREARAAGALSHPNIIQVFDAGEQEGMYYFAMEFVEGETLAGKVEREGPLSEQATVAIGMCVAAALHYAWTKTKIIHRDIKPDNIMLTPDGVVKVCDLGLAKTAGSGDSGLTMSGMMMGTPHYIAPEQARGDRNIDVRADIYSLGATLFHLITGQPPFTADSAMSVMYMHVNDPLPNPRDFVPNLSDGFVRVLAKMTAKDPADRYQNMLELYNDLELLYQGLAPAAEALPTARSGIRTPPTPDEAALKSLRRGLRFWRVAGSIGFVVIGLVGLLIWKQLEQQKALPHKPAKINPGTRSNTVAQIPAPAAPAARPQGAPSLPPLGLGLKRPRDNAKYFEMLKQVEQRQAEQRKAEEEAERQHVETRAKNAARLKAEEEYRDFLQLWQPSVAARDYVKAELVAGNAVKDVTMALVKPRLESHLEMSRRLKAFDQAFRAALPLLKGKQVTYGGRSGTVSAIDEKGITIDKTAGAGWTLPLTPLRVEDLLSLALTAMGSDNPEALINAGLVAMSEAHGDWAKRYFDNARLLDQSKEGTAKTAALRFDDLRDVIEKSQTEAAVEAALDEVQALITKSKWPEATIKLAVTTKQFADTTTLQCSTDRVQDMHDAIIAAETGADELRAQLTLNRLHQDVEEKSWKHAAQMLQAITVKFSSTEVVKQDHGLAQMRELVASRVPAGAVAVPSVRDLVASRKGATIHHVDDKSKGNNYFALDVSIAQAKDGDGIQLEDGVYVLKGPLRGNGKSISLFGKPGALPVVVVLPNKKTDAGFEISGPKARWQFENIQFIARGRPDDPTATFPVVALSNGASAEFKQCAFVQGAAGNAALTPLARYESGAGGEVTLHNCLVVNSRGIELQQPCRVRVEQTTWLGGGLLWFPDAGAVPTRTTLSMRNSLVLANASWGIFGGQVAKPTSHPAVAAELLKQLDLSRVSHSVLLAASNELLEPWREPLEGPNHGNNYLALATDTPPLVVLKNQETFDYRLSLECPAGHAADDGRAVGARWTDAQWNHLRANIQQMAERVGKRPAQ